MDSFAPWVVLVYIATGFLGITARRALGLYSFPSAKRKARPACPLLPGPATILLAYFSRGGIWPVKSPFWIALILGTLSVEIQYPEAVMRFKTASFFERNLFPQTRTSTFPPDSCLLLLSCQ